MIQPAQPPRPLSGAGPPGRAYPLHTSRPCREIPLAGEPADVAEIVSDYSRYLPTAGFPKLFINAEPGAILTGDQREFARTWANQSEVTVEGIHFVQEDSAEQIGTAVAEWMSDR